MNSPLEPALQARYQRHHELRQERILLAEQGRENRHRLRTILDSLGGGNSEAVTQEMNAPVSTDDRSKNPLRPIWLRDVIGQDDAKRMMQHVIDRFRATGEPLDHILLVGQSGTGKSTFSHVIANEIERNVFEVEAPVDHERLLELREVMKDGDILRIEEIHMQAVAQRRGKSTGNQPELLYGVMEDRVLASGNGLVSFPNITIIGTTTDEGMLPDAFINRFPLRPTLVPYSQRELEVMAVRNGEQLALTLVPEAAEMFAAASRGVPRQINNYVKNAAILSGTDRYIVPEMAQEVLHTMNRVTPDGLTADMVGVLVFLYLKGRREKANGDVVYQASVSTLATAIGKSRDAKAIQLRVEPYLIEQGYLQVGSGGRLLTDTGAQRARELLIEDPTRGATT